jgi:ribosomal protein S18 acetylase RimI-like enzyme
VTVDATSNVPDRVLDNPVWSALTGPQSVVAQRHRRAVRYDPEVSVFGALDHDGDEEAWWDAARLPEAGAMVVVAAAAPPPRAWEIQMDLPGIQMVAETLELAHDLEATPLGPADAAEVLALVARTRPGPFLARTLELGAYLGVRRDGVLVAMAGERMRLPGWTEISAVCTDESARGSGLASRLVRAVGANIRARGDGVVLHVAATNTNAIRLYRTLGFVERRRLDFMVVQPTSRSGF